MVHHPRPELVLAILVTCQRMNVTKPNNLPNNCAILEAAKEGLGPREHSLPLSSLCSFWVLGSSAPPPMSRIYRLDVR